MTVVLVALAAVGYTLGVGWVVSRIGRFIRRADDDMRATLLGLSGRCPPAVVRQGVAHEGAAEYVKG